VHLLVRKSLIFLDENFKEKSKHTFYAQKCFYENRAIYEIIWKIMVDPDRTQMAIWRMRFACWIPKATDRHSEYVIIIAFTLQNRLRDRASKLRLD
jgi:hypothetical protein